MPQKTTSNKLLLNLYASNILKNCSLPKKLINLSFNRTLDTASDLKKFYERNGTLVDEELRKSFVNNIQRAIVTQEVQQIVEETSRQTVFADDEKWEKIESSSAFIKLSKIQPKGEKNKKNKWGKAELVVDACAEEVLGWLWDYCSNERTNSVEEFEKNPREIITTMGNGLNQNLISSIKQFPWPLHNRHYIVENAWMRMEDGSYVYACRTPMGGEFDDIVANLVNFGRNKSQVRGDLRVFARIRNIREGGSDSCSVTFLQTSDAKGSIPPKVLEREFRRQLRSVFELREKFNRDDEFDKLERLKLMGVMRCAEKEEYSEKETELVCSVRQKMERIHDDKFRPLNSPDFRTRMGIAHIEGDKEGGYLKCEVTIDASVEEVSEEFAILRFFDFNLTRGDVARSVRHTNS